MGCPLSDPSPLYCDNCAVHAIIESERMTPRCRHFDIPIAFLHAHKGSVYEATLITTDKMLADMGTKPNTPTLLKRFKYWTTGERFLPGRDHEHYDLLQMQFYEIPFHDILKMVNNMNSSQNILH